MVWLLANYVPIVISLKRDDIWQLWISFVCLVFYSGYKDYQPINHVTIFLVLIKQHQHTEIIQIWCLNYGVAWCDHIKQNVCLSALVGCICILLKQTHCKAWHVCIINTLRPRQNGCHFADDTFKHIFMKENVTISISISLKFVPNSPIDNIPALFQIMACRRPGDKPLSEAMMVINELINQAVKLCSYWYRIYYKVISKFIFFLLNDFCMSVHVTIDNVSVDLS